MTELIVGGWIVGMVAMHLLLSWDERRTWPDGRPRDHPGHVMLATLWPITLPLLFISAVIWIVGKVRES